MAVVVIVVVAYGAYRVHIRQDPNSGLCPKTAYAIHRAKTIHVECLVVLVPLTWKRTGEYVILDLFHRMSPQRVSARYRPRALP